jgi:hypothetical protein
MSDSFEIRFENPPPIITRWAKSVALDYEQIAKALVARPGEWAFVGVTATPTRAGGAASRTVDGEYRVYARFLGEAGEVAS